MDLIQTIILAIVEGLTEFLPISSTGHMVIVSRFLGIEENEFVKNFEVIIQFAAILSVVVIYWKKFFPIQDKINFYKKILISFIPTALIGFFLKNKVDEWLESPQLVAWTLLFGGIILILSDRWFQKQIHNGKKTDELNHLDCLKLGIIQSLAIIPGVSRSGATIVGGLFLGLQKKEAAEYSFFLAVPTMAAATGYKMFKVLKNIETNQIESLAQPLIIGSLISFAVAYLSIKFFIHIVSLHGFNAFGIYRIILGSLILGLIWSGQL